MNLNNFRVENIKIKLCNTERALLEGKAPYAHNNPGCNMPKVLSGRDETDDLEVTVAVCSINGPLPKQEALLMLIGKYSSETLFLKNAGIFLRSC